MNAVRYLVRLSRSATSTRSPEDVLDCEKFVWWKNCGEKLKCSPKWEICRQIQLSNGKFLVRSIKLRSSQWINDVHVNAVRYLVRLDSPSTTSTRSPEDVLDCENIFNWPLWEELYQSLMDGFLDVFFFWMYFGCKALWKGLYSRRDCIRQHINFPAVLWAWLKKKECDLRSGPM